MGRKEEVGERLEAMKTRRAATGSMLQTGAVMDERAERMELIVEEGISPMLRATLRAGGAWRQKKSKQADWKETWERGSKFHMDCPREWPTENSVK
jgi:Zn-dependent M32 family carboxypeptidase